MRQIGIDDPNEAVRMVNAGEVKISTTKSKWTQKDGVINFSVTSDGTTGEQWITRLESKGFCIGDYVKGALHPKDLKPTSGVVYEIAVLKGELFSDNGRITKNIRKEAKNRKLLTPNVEVACLIREKFSDKELEAMGLYWIAIMHEPIKYANSSLKLLRVRRNYDGPWLDTSSGAPDRRWDNNYGFAFVIS